MQGPLEGLIGHLEFDRMNTSSASASEAPIYHKEFDTRTTEGLIDRWEVDKQRPLRV